MIAPRLIRLVALATLGSFVLAACYSFAEPSFRPGDPRDVFAAIVRRGIITSEPLAGQTACDDPGMIANTLYVTARLPDEAQARDVYIHTYREKRWEESIEEVDACEAAYAAANPDSEISRFDIPTYRVFGADWSEELTRELVAAFEEASTAG
ncbi:MAG: hypothetical protein ACC726_07890 [Chloroflexota bacterium]